MKLSFQDLAVEVTRRCNMNCAHCMRGEAQDIDLDLEKFDKFLENVSHIDTITFTGGEPTLNINAIRHILETCKKNKIDVYNFYLVTNGKKIENEFLNLMVDWYAYCYDCGGEPEYSGLALSQDEYHESFDIDVVAKLKAFSFFNMNDKKTDWEKAYLVDLGRARSIGGHTKRDPHYYPPTVEECDDTIRVYDGSVIAFTCDGDILFDCDYEYESTDNIKACDYSNALDEFHKMATDPDYEFCV